MNDPINHHFVSRCHLKYFFNDMKQRIYLYDKTKKRSYSRKSTKYIFSKKRGNSRFRDGALDNVTLEHDLKFHFEDHYDNHLNIVNKFSQSGNEIGTQQLLDSLYFFLMYAIIGETRHPLYKSSIDNAFVSIFNTLAEISTSELKSKIENRIESLKLIPHSNMLKYSDIANSSVESIGECTFKIYYIKSEFEFILPDTTAFRARFPLKQNAPHLNLISQIAIPISSKLLVVATSKKIDDGSDQLITINSDSRIVDFFNKLFYDFSYEQLASRTPSLIDKYASST